MTPTAKQEFQTQQRIKNVLEEVYLRILLNDDTTTTDRKLRILNNLFNDGTPSTLTVVHMEVFDKVRHMMKVMKENGVEITYGASLPDEVYHNTHHAHPKNQQDFPCETQQAILESTMGQLRPVLQKALLNHGIPEAVSIDNPAPKN